MGRRSEHSVRFAFLRVDNLDFGKVLIWLERNIGESVSCVGGRWMSVTFALYAE